MGSGAASTGGSGPSSAHSDRTDVKVPMRTLGRTGERVSAIGLGGVHLGKPDLSEAESIHIIRTAIDAASISSTTPGTTTRDGVSSGWERPSGMATETEPS